MSETFALLIALAAVIGIFVVIPLVVFLIVRKVLSDRHRERMAMIESGLSHKYRAPRPDTEQDHREATATDASENNPDTTPPPKPPPPNNTAAPGPRTRPSSGCTSSAGQPSD